MEKVILAHTLLVKALLTLKKSFATIEKAKQLNDQEFLDAAKDSCVQRFEYSFDSFWKFLKKYLMLKYSMQDINSPAAVFRAGVKVNLYSSDDGDILLAMIADRNETTHNYSAEEVRRISANIPQYYALMDKITQSVASQSQ